MERGLIVPRRESPLQSETPQGTHVFEGELSPLRDRVPLHSSRRDDVLDPSWTGGNRHRSESGWVEPAGQVCEDRLRTPGASGIDQVENGPHRLYNTIM